MASSSCGAAITASIETTIVEEAKKREAGIGLPPGLMDKDELSRFVQLMLAVRLHPLTNSIN